MLTTFSIKGERMGKEVKKIVDTYANIIDMPFVNEIISNSGKLDDFEMNKTTMMNIAEWALNGSSDEEIRKKLDLTPTQWQVLVSVCPTLILVMQHSRALADTIIAGSLFQTAIGGKRIKKQVPKPITEYDEKGKPCGQHYELIEVWEELPPNPILLKFIAEQKLSEKFGDQKVDNTRHYQEIINNLSPEQMALMEMAQKGGALDEHKESDKQD